VPDILGREGEDEDGMNMQGAILGTDAVTETIAARDGTPILVRRWPAADPWAHLLLVHGVAEHSGRYDRTGGLFAAAGIDVTSFDLRGHGSSGGRRGDVERWTDFLDDIEERLAVVRSAAGDRPVVLMGHSMGGLLVTDYLLASRPGPDLVVLSGPALDDDLPRWQHAIAPVTARLLPTLAVKNAWGPEALSRDPEVGRRAIADPLCPPAATLRLGAGGFQAQARVRSSLRGFGVPTLVFHGGDDPLVPTRASEVFEGLPGCTRRVYPGLRHETLNEPEGPAVVGDVIAWLREQVAARTAARAATA
jgi:alpha-beta hydrolase superfamily lysophospholipase